MRRFCKPRNHGGQQLEFRDKVEIAKACFKGLKYLHKRSLCHRDISPDNILVSNACIFFQLRHCIENFLLGFS